jgi:hypothetical protein
LAIASGDPRHIATLIGLRLERLQLDSGFGFEAAVLHVVVAEPLIARQPGLAMGEEHVAPVGLSCLVARLRQRLGSGGVNQLQPVESHIPERAERAIPIQFAKAKAQGQGLTQEAAKNVQPELPFLPRRISDRLHMEPDIVIAARRRVSSKRHVPFMVLIVGSAGCALS